MQANYLQWILSLIVLGLSLSCSDTVFPNDVVPGNGSETTSDSGSIPDSGSLGDVGIETEDGAGVRSDGSTGDDGASPDRSPVDTWGPYRVGYSNFQLTYDDMGGDGAGRTVKVHLWYPTDAVSGETVLYDFLSIDDMALGEVAPRPPADGEGYPLLIHSHGHMAFGTVSYTLMDYFASHVGSRSRLITQEISLVSVEKHRSIIGGPWIFRRC